MNIINNIAKESTAMAKSKLDTTELIIKKFQKIHGETFDYSLVEYVSHASKVVIICQLHGEFEQQPRLHLRGSTGCRPCIALRGK